MVLLELDWNLYDWEPQFDFKGIASVIVSVAVLAIIYFLARSTRDRFSKTVSFLLVVTLAGISIYTFPRETQTSGLFARQSPSPLWYRGGRLLLMILPGVFWTIGVFGKRKATIQSPS
jgi:amino acid permease